MALERVEQQLASQSLWLCHLHSCTAYCEETLGTNKPTGVMWSAAAFSTHQSVWSGNCGAPQLTPAARGGDVSEFITCATDAIDPFTESQHCWNQ